MADWDGWQAVRTMNEIPDSAKRKPSYRVPAPRGSRITLDPHPGSPDPRDGGAVRSWLEGRPRPWAIDLFCGAGGLSLGLEQAGFSVVAAADSDPVSTETHAANIEALTWTGDLSDPTGFIRQLDEWGIEHVDLLAGGPPCQPFSRAGTSKIGNLVRMGVRPARDGRADLWRSFFAIVDRLNPRAMLFENVPDFAKAQGGALLIALREELRLRGYGFHIQVLEAWRYRVPQYRSPPVRDRGRGGRRIRLAHARGRASNGWGGHRRPSGGSRGEPERGPALWGTPGLGTCKVFPKGPAGWGSPRDS